MNIDPLSPMNAGSTLHDLLGAADAAPAADRIDPRDEARREVARDFESVFMQQLLDTMKDTIPDPEAEDAGAEQIQGMYWSFLSQAVAEQGGLGLWQPVYEAIRRGEINAAMPPDPDRQQEHTLDETL